MLLSRRCLLIATAAWPGMARAAPALEWVAGNLPPFAWESAGVPHGLAQDLAVAMAQRLGRPTQVTYLPWARAVRTVEQGDHYGIFPLARTPDREARFRWLVPLMAALWPLHAGHGGAPGDRSAP